MSDPIVGIDLGTSNSVVAHADAAGTVKVLADDSGYKVHPSVVSFHPNGGVVVGAAAKQRRVIDPQNTIYSVKRLIGRSYRSPEVQTAKTRAPFLIKEGPNTAPMIVTRGGEFAVPEISAIVLDHVRNIASARLEVPVARAVVTVPASFNDAQRSATATAGAIAGLTVVRVLNEPTAAALAYGHTRQLREIIAVYDFGGGTFDITLLKLDDQVYEVLGTSGDTFLGGDDLDERLVDKMVAKFLAENRIDLRTNEVSMMRLRAVAEQTKIELSRRSRAVVRIDEIAYGPRGAPLNLQIEISRDEFVKEVADIIDRTFPVCTEALALAQISTDRISDVILVGGTSKIPYVRDQVSKYFGKAPRTDINPEDAVAVGAALQATSLERILSRRPLERQSREDQDDERRRGAPSRVAAARAPEEETTTQGLPDVLELAPPGAPSGDAPDANDASGATMAPSELTVSRAKRATASYHETPRSGSEITKPDTSYSVTRSGVRDAVDDLDDRRPIGRMARTEAATPPPIPAAPTLPVPPDPSRPVTVPGAAIPPPLPRRGPAGAPARPMPFQQTVPLSPVQRAPDIRTPILPYPPVLPTSPPPQPIPPTPVSGAFEIPPAEWTDDSGISASPAAAPTLVAVAADAALGPTARGFAAPTFIVEPSAPSTAKGFPAPQIPQSYPIQPAPPTRPPPVLLEVTPRGLGIATVAGYCEELIRRNVRVPTEAKRMFTTSRDQQELVRIVVCQGESRRLDSNIVIGDLVLQGLPRRPRGETSIEVTFAIDASGILHVRARDAQTGTEQRASLALVGDVAEEDVATSRDRLQLLRR